MMFWNVKEHLMLTLKPLLINWHTGTPHEVSFGFPTLLLVQQAFEYESQGQSCIGLCNKAGKWCVSQCSAEVWDPQVNEDNIWQHLATSGNIW